ncbi:hypothetical protein BDV95DRAFT_169445 [Massariosphaeria phaeospora]|uniref:Uncharacterized protein n=1 Tax=Massariosphaeria phaeospora TaxID=100035 RepID=A0A7C8I832_9PLEO|nr:hypothetical protein BDV95DRAFT_169445 [Massariosphaeria phaeospora]
MLAGPVAEAVRRQSARRDHMQLAAGVRPRQPEQLRQRWASAARQRTSLTGSRRAVRRPSVIRRYHHSFPAVSSAGRLESGSRWARRGQAGSANRWADQRGKVRHRPSPIARRAFQFTFGRRHTGPGRKNRRFNSTPDEPRGSISTSCPPDDDDNDNDDNDDYHRQRRLPPTTAPPRCLSASTTAAAARPVSTQRGRPAAPGATGRYST